MNLKIIEIMFEEIRQHNVLVRDQIYKGFTGGEQLLEKAHQVGDIHPNGKWVWTQLSNGKYDWRARKDGAAKKPDNKQVKFSDKEKKELEQLQDEIDKMGFESRLSPDKEKRYNELKKKKFAAHIDAFNPDVVGKEQAHKNFIDYIEGNGDNKSINYDKKVHQQKHMTIDDIPNAAFKRITSFLEKKNPDDNQAWRYLDEEGMDDKELAQFRTVAEYFRYGGKLNASTRERVKKWANMAIEEAASRQKRKRLDDSKIEDSKEGAKNNDKEGRELAHDLLKEKLSKTDNESLTWRRGGYEVVKELAKTYGEKKALNMVLKEASAFQGATQALVFNTYIKRRVNGDDDEKADNYARSKYKGLTGRDWKDSDD